MCYQYFRPDGNEQPGRFASLKQLKAGGLITSRREGKEVYYKAAETKQVDLLHRMIEKLVEINCPTGYSSPDMK